MDILLQSDGQLYPPRHAERRPPPKPEPPKPPPPKPVPPPPKPKPPAPAPCPPPQPAEHENRWEDLLILAVAFIILRSGDKPDIPLLLALAYVLFDSCFSLGNLL